MSTHKEIQTKIMINAPVSKVWEVFTDFASYPAWNPWVTSLEGDVVVGQKITIHAGGMKFKPEVLVYEENKELRWLGKLWFSGIFDGEHIFQLEDNGDGTTTFIQNEKFKGMLVKPFSKKLDGETKDGFEKMNQMLKERVENL